MKTRPLSWVILTLPLPKQAAPLAAFDQLPVVHSHSSALFTAGDWAPLVFLRCLWICLAIGIHPSAQCMEAEPVADNHFKKNYAVSKVAHLVFK